MATQDLDLDDAALARLEHMPSSEPGREAPDEPRWVAAVEPRFAPRLPTNGQRLGSAPPERVVYAEPSTIHDAFSRYWLLIVLVAVIGAAAGVAQAMSKQPVYTASAQLGVGLTNVGTPGGLGGFAQSGPTLAAAYSRAAIAQPVVSSVAKGAAVELGAVVSRGPRAEATGKWASGPAGVPDEATDVTGGGRAWSTSREAG